MLGYLAVMSIKIIMGPLVRFVKDLAVKFYDGYFLRVSAPLTVPT